MIIAILLQELYKYVKCVNGSRAFQNINVLLQRAIYSTDVKGYSVQYIKLHIVLQVLLLDIIRSVDKR